MSTLPIAHGRAVPLNTQRSSSFSFVLARHASLLIAVGVFVAAFLLLNLYLANGFGYDDLASTAAGATALALAAMGQTIVIIGGGLDLSAGAVISLANALVVTQMGPSPVSQIAWAAAGVLAGGGIGAVNGFFVVRLKLQPVVVTLATMFITQGVTLLILRQPGGSVPAEFSSALAGNALGGWVPMPLVVIGVALLVWAWIRNSRLGMQIYAIGSDESAAGLKGISVAKTQFLSYVLGGCFYGSAGVFLTAQTGSGDPLIGASMLLPIFVASVLGGTPLGGGRGGCVGSILGAFTVTLIANILLLADVSTYFSTVVEGCVLIAAMIGNSLMGDSALKRGLRNVFVRRKAQGRPASKPVVPVLRDRNSKPTSEVFERNGWTNPSWDRAFLKLIGPAYIGLVLIALLTAVLFRSSFQAGDYVASLLMLSAFLIVLAAGQGAVIVSGGLDLSVPNAISLAGVLLTGLADGSNSAALWAVPLVLGAGVLIGVLNGLGVHLLGISPFLMTLGMNGILQGLTLVYSNGSPTGLAPPALRWLMTGHIGGVIPVLPVMGIFVLVVTALFHRTVYGRRLFAIGSNPLAARFAAVPVGRTLIQTYAFSGLCAALVGVMSVGFTGQAFNDMGDPYLLTSIAVVVVGGTLMSGGKGHYLGMLGGALMLTALATLLSGTTLPPAARNVIYGLVVLVAVVGMRERSRR